MMKNAQLLLAAVGAVSSFSGILTDAPECAHSVAAAENLMSLAARLADDSAFEMKGVLLADGEKVCHATVSIDGSLTVVLPADVETCNRTWQLELEGVALLPVTMFDNEEDDEPAWVIAAPEAFYSHLLS